MFHILLFILLCLASPLHAVTDEVAVATQFMQRQGCDVRRMKLTATEDGYPELCILEDASAHRFAIVARAPYSASLTERVLAYGTENAFHGTESAWKRNLIDTYREQLQQLQHTRPPRAAAMPTPYVPIPPLLRTTWGQGYPYNIMCNPAGTPMGQTLTGCVSTAMSQLMFYHQWPAQGTGRFTTGGTARQPVQMDFASIRPAWAQMLPQYASNARTTDASVQAVARLMQVNAQAVSSDFTGSGTAASCMFARSVLVNHWHYSPACQYVRRPGPRMAQSAILQQLQQHLPVLISGGQHAFVCDGAHGDFLHFNLGWNTAANGYYRILLHPSLNSKSHQHCIVGDMLLQLMPDKAPSTAHRLIHVTKPGTLSTLLSARECRELRSLTLVGTLDGQDVALLRRMLGATDAWMPQCADILPSPTPWAGQLQQLDISQVHIQSDDHHPYLRTLASGCRYANGRYDFDRPMSHALYRQFLREPYITRGDGYRFVFGPDSLHCIEYYTQRDAISPLMFYDCQNLRNLTLPRTCRHIMSKAFQWCHSLVSLALPPSIRDIESGAFAQCYLLQRVLVQDIPTEVCHRLSPQHVDGQYGQTQGQRHIGLFQDCNIHTCQGIVLDGKPLTQIPYKSK